MIPKTLSDIEWSDIERLVELSREEDDRIEFKSSFKGEDDYASLNDSQRQKALDSLAREVIAFLNTRGGDLVIGIEESDDARPAATGVRLMKNPAGAADRIARGLAAVVEPAQTNISVRGVQSPDDASGGIVVVRAEASVRAPHRSKRTLECYARRGSESVPMAMDEIQDLTINRTRLRLEQMEFLDRQFTDFSEGNSEHRDFGDEVIHVRTVVVPLLDQSFTVDDTLLAAFSNTNPQFYDSNGRATRNDVAFRGLHSRWQPVLRGRKQESFDEYGGDTYEDFQYARKLVRESGVCVFDYAVCSHFDGDVASAHVEWFVGYFAQVAVNLEHLFESHPAAFPCSVRVGIRSRGDMRLGFGSGMWAQKKSFPSDIYFFPDFVVTSPADLNAFFQQAQVDLYSLLNESQDQPYSLLNANDSEASGHD